MPDDLRYCTPDEVAGIPGLDYGLRIKILGFLESAEHPALGDNSAMATPSLSLDEPYWWDYLSEEEQVRIIQNL